MSCIGFTVTFITCSSFIHSGYFNSISSSPLLLRGAPDTARIPCWEFHAEAPQATASEGHAQGPCETARAGFKPATLRSKGDKSTNEPPCLTHPQSVERALV